MDQSTVGNVGGAFSNIQETAGDEVFSMMKQAAADPNPNKVSLSVGVFKTDEGTSYLLPSVSMAMDRLKEEDKEGSFHDYLPLDGYPPFIHLSQQVVFGEKRPSAHLASIQTVSGTGANHVGAKFLLEQLPPVSPLLPRQKRAVWISNPTWANHHLIWDMVLSSASNTSPAEGRFYPYYDPVTCELDFEGMVTTIETEAQQGDIILLHACAHNPTGIDPTPEQWQQIARLCQRKGIFPLFDSAYQGFASGSLDRDAYAIRLFASLDLELCVAQSFSKNLGLYGQRVGAFHLRCRDGETARKAHAQLMEIQRGELSMPPAYGARIASVVLSDPVMYTQWTADLLLMSGRIKAMRNALYNELVALKTPGSWEHIVQQIGMFSYTGLSPEQVFKLRNDWSIYAISTGRFSIAGLNTSNVKYVAKAVDTVVRETTRR